MDIKIEAIGHPNQEKLISYYNETLTKKYANYPFVKTITAKVDNKENLAEVTLLFQLEKGGRIFATHRNENEHTSLKGAIKKINTQIEKYKEKHYG